MGMNSTILWYGFWRKDEFASTTWQRQTNFIGSKARKNFQQTQKLWVLIYPKLDLKCNKHRLLFGGWPFFFQRISTPIEKFTKFVNHFDQRCQPKHVMKRIWKPSMWATLGRVPEIPTSTTYLWVIFQWLYRAIGGNVLGTTAGGYPKFSLWILFGRFRY